jgi:hypothetical protein
MKKLIAGREYWIKHNVLLSRHEGQVAKTLSGRTEVSLVQVAYLDKEVNAYFCFPMGHDVCFGISIKDIKDAVLVENPFKDVGEDTI